ncbi:MAG: hypothetical protein M0Z30_06180, partial [Actinomycetota bacterium]|nr:hypothetical protein [Actinomycetota bacterium]
MSVTVGLVGPYPITAVAAPPAQRPLQAAQRAVSPSTPITPLGKVVATATSRTLPGPSSPSASLLSQVRAMTQTTTPPLPPKPTVRKATPAAKPLAAQSIPALTPLPLPIPNPMVPGHEAYCTDSWTGNDAALKQNPDASIYDANNWSTGLVPGQYDYVCVPNPFRPGGLVDVAGGPVWAGLYAPYGGVTVEQPGTLDLVGTAPSVIASLLIQNDGTLETAGPVGLTGVISSQNATFEGSGTITIEPGSTLTVNGPTTVTGNIDNEGTVSVASGQALDLAAGSVFDNDTAGATTNGGTIATS